jgi:hypothetical protein
VSVERCVRARVCMHACVFVCVRAKIGVAASVGH